MWLTQAWAKVWGRGAPLHWATGSLQPWASPGKCRRWFGVLQASPSPGTTVLTHLLPLETARGPPAPTGVPTHSLPHPWGWKVGAASPFGTHPGLCFERDFRKETTCFVHLSGPWVCTKPSTCSCGCGRV